MAKKTVVAGSTSSKAKDKKAARKAETERLLALKRLLAQQNEGDNLLAELPAFTTYDRRGLTAQLRFYKSAALPPGMLDWALGLTRTHMQALYEATPNWGWSDAKKRAELAHSDARYVVVTAAALSTEAGQAAGAGGSTDGAGASAEVVTEAAAPQAAAPAAEAAVCSRQQVAQQALGQAVFREGQPVAFMHFRFEEEEGEAVAYLYEIQVEAAAQGKGLGAFLMRLLELLAWRAGAARLMLTVFHANEAAVAMYNKLGWVLDDSSPELHGPAGNCAYKILTKRPKTKVTS